MMLSRRRIMLQLTPLLDLLLIVMFSQYIENRNRTIRTDEELVRQRNDVEEYKTELAESYEARRQELAQQIRQERESLAADRAAVDDLKQSLIAQHQQAGTLLAQSLNLPESAFTEVLRLRAAGAEDDAERLSSAVQQLRELMNDRGEELFRTLVRFDEIGKHVSVWEVYLQDNGQALITDQQQSRTIDFGTDDEFVTRLYEASKSFAEPRPLVVILLSWGDTQAGQRRRAAGAMPALMDQMRRDASGTRWYDFSIVGFRATGPLIQRDRP